MFINDGSYFRFEIGDIVKEDELIVFWDEHPLIGIVIDIERRAYWLPYDKDEIYQDRLTVLWLRKPFVENIPSDLVILVSRAQHESKNEKK